MADELPPPPPSTPGVVSVSLAGILAYMELAFALHDAKLLDRNVLADRIDALAKREDLQLDDSLRVMLRHYAEGLRQTTAPGKS